MNAATPTQVMLRKIQDALVESTVPSRRCFEVGGFILMLTPDEPLVWINYAVPIRPQTANGVPEMVDVFRAEKRSPRLEFFVDLWPDLPAELEAHGFTCEKRMPIMVLEQAEWRGHAHAHDVRAVGAEDIRKLSSALAEAFGMPRSDDDESGTDTMRGNLAAGRALGAMVVIDGVVAGGGYAVGTTAIREVAGIGTREPYRRRGVASAVIGNLLDRFFGGGGEIAWLTPGDDSAQSVYARLGFQPVGEQVCYQVGD
jgi:GNAT superfamily N-acetyltransferase